MNPTAQLPSLGQTLDKSATATGGLTAGTAAPSSTKKGNAGIPAGPMAVKQGGVFAGMAAGLMGVFVTVLAWL